MIEPKTKRSAATGPPAVCRFPPVDARHTPPPVDAIPGRPPGRLQARQEEEELFPGSGGEVLQPGLHQERHRPAVLRGGG